MKKLFAISIFLFVGAVVIYLLIPKEYKSLYKQSREFSKEFSKELGQMAKQLQEAQKWQDIYFKAIESNDISLCADESFPQETKFFCKAIISKDVKYCDALADIPLMSPARHAQCIDDVLEKIIPPPNDKLLCEGLKNYENIQMYYNCRAKVMSDINECEEIIAQDINGRIHSYDLAVGNCMDGVLEVTKDKSLCDEMKRIEEKHSFSNHYSENCFKNYR